MNRHIIRKREGLNGIFYKLLIAFCGKTVEGGAKWADLVDKQEGECLACNRVFRAKR